MKMFPADIWEYPIPKIGNFSFRFLGKTLDEIQLHQKDQIISPLIEQGQSPYQILTNHPELDMSVRSMYTYIDDGQL